MSMNLDQVKSTLEDLVRNVRAATANSLGKQSRLYCYQVGKIETFDEEEYCLGFSIEIDETDTSVAELRFTLADATYHDGIEPDEDGWGLNILVDLFVSGHIVLSQAPYNNTDEVWTNDPEELILRIESIDPYEINYALLEQIVDTP